MTAVRHIDAVIFDFDGTLAKLNINFSRMRTGILDLIEACQVPSDGLNDLLVLEMIDAAASLISIKNPQQEKIFVQRANDLIVNIEIEAATKGELICGTRDMLSLLKERKIKTGVITRNCQTAVSSVFPDIGEYCDVVLTREMTHNVKPHPEHLMQALKALEVDPEFASIVGDHPMDIKIGKGAGAFTIGVLSGYSSSRDLMEAGADIIISKAADIVDLLF